MKAKIKKLREEAILPEKAHDSDVGYDLYAVHPGGKSIIDAIKKGLGISETLLAPSYDILRNFGNMSSPSIMFVLENLLVDPLAAGDGMMMAFGPGISVETMQFEKST